MTIYFITELSHDNPIDPLRIKIGRSVDVKRRMSNLQTGNPDELALMGVINTHDIAEDKVVEKSLHDKYASNRLTREWFSLGAADVIDALKAHSSLLAQIRLRLFRTTVMLPLNLPAHGHGAMLKYGIFAPAVAGQGGGHTTRITAVNGA